jgi:uncharacterized protein with HEPN domain
MNAKKNDLLRIQEIYQLTTLTKAQLESLGLTKEAFLNPKNDNDELVVEGFMNRVFRITEEMGKVSDAVAEKYGIDSAGARGVRNRLAHVYGDVDAEIVWNILADELDSIIVACKSYCEENNL